MSPVLVQSSSDDVGVAILLWIISLLVLYVVIRLAIVHAHRQLARERTKPPLGLRVGVGDVVEYIGVTIPGGPPRRSPGEVVELSPGLRGSPVRVRFGSTTHSVSVADLQLVTSRAETGD